MPTEKNFRIAAIISLIVLGILLAGSLVFYKERMLFSDAAWIAFHTINTGSVQIQADRYGSFITQMFPVAGSKLGLSLKALLILYSLSFNLFYFLTGYLLFRMHRYALVVLLAFFLTLFVSEAYFWTNNEVYQGITWMFLMFGSIISLYRLFKGKIILFYAIALPVFTALAFFAVYSHPLVMIPTAFLWCFLFLYGEEKFFRTIHSIFFAFIIIAIDIFKIRTSANNSYDSGILEKVFHANLQDVFATFTSGMADIFWKNLISNHWLIALLFVSGIIYLIRRKKFLLAGYTALSCLTYFVLMCLTFSDGSKPYIESEWMCLAIIGAAPFVYYVIPSMRPKMVVLSVASIFLVRLIYISAAVPKYTARIAIITTITDIMKERGITKAIIRKTDERLEQKMVIGWALPLETLFTSILAHDSLQRTAACLGDDEIKQLITQNPSKDFVLPFGVNRISQINHQYFKLDTIQTYQTFSCEEFFGSRISLLSSD